MTRHVETPQYHGPDRRERASVTGALKEAYTDMGAIIRGAGQLIVVGAGLLWAWNSLENTASQNRDRITKLEGTVEAQGAQLADVPLLKQTADGLQRAVERLVDQLAEASKMGTDIATLGERMKGLQSQIERLDRTISREQSQSRYPPGSPG